MNIKLNQEIIVVPIGNNSRYSTKIHRGIVTKISRKWFDVDTFENEQFSLEDGRCNGKNYSPEWQVFESEEDYKESKERPALRREVENSTYGLSYKQLTKVLEFIKTL